ncbi:hypothetical protein OA40_04515 [Morganella morganii]|nr:hypothetical protein OA40_04515 [Morganella morganii]MBA5809419.1 hypothetical protein [Morganella morganii]
MGLIFFIAALFSLKTKTESCQQSVLCPDDKDVIHLSFRDVAQKTETKPEQKRNIAKNDNLPVIMKDIDYPLINIDSFRQSL